MVTARAAETDLPPSADRIAAVMRPLALGAGGGANAQWGNWVGPRPRVTRDRDWGLATPPNVTRVSWLYAFPAGAFYDAHHDYMVQQLANAVTAGLRNADPGPNIAGLVTPWESFDPARVDPATVDAATIAWWDSGHAASEAQFVDTIPTLPTTVPDNPTAPGMAAAGGDSILPSASTVDRVVGAAKVIAVLAVATVAAIELGPPLVAWGAKRIA